MRTGWLPLSALILASVFSSHAVAITQTRPSQTAEAKDGRRCLWDLRAFDEELEKVGFGVQPPSQRITGLSGPSSYGGERTPRQKIKSLRDAAYIYALDRDELSCQKILTSMRTLYRQRQALTGSEVDNTEVRKAWRRAHLARAEPVTKMQRLMRADLVIGADVRNTKDQKLGEIRDIILDPSESSIAYALLARGGFLGWGGNRTAVRWRDLRATSDHAIYVLDVPSSTLDRAPVIEGRTFERTADAEWRRTLDQFWDEALR